LIKFVPRPYKLFNKIQHYDWGTRDAHAFIPGFLGIEPQPDTPYAELWIGAHPKAPSEIQIDDRRVPLNEIIAEFGRESLGDYVSKKFSGKLPFLLKVLSAAEALSIQTHPSKDQAVKLHASHPDKYPDDNHKPEIAIALDSLTALVGFKPAAKIAATLLALPELREYAEERLIEGVTEVGKTGDRERAIKELYADIMRRADEKEKLSSCILKIRERLSRKTSPAPEEIQFLKQYEVYGATSGFSRSSFSISFTSDGAGDIHRRRRAARLHQGKYRRMYGQLRQRRQSWTHK